MQLLSSRQTKDIDTISVRMYIYCVLYDNTIILTSCMKSATSSTVKRPDELEQWNSRTGVRSVV